MLILYNLILAVLLILVSPLLFVKAIVTPKYRHRLPSRFGMGLQRPGDGKLPRPRIWIHALSVGEVRSSLSLVQGIRNAFPGGSIFFSTTTMTGDRLARKTLHDRVDRFLAFPFDLPWVVNRFIRLLRPDMFILVETDFWPNLLFTLQRSNIPTVLVNGRISRRSHQRYKMLRFFFRPMFRTFSLMAMQTRIDADRLLELGVAAERTKVLGNLKFDTLCAAPTAGEAQVEGQPPDLPWPGDRTILIAGSTHPGEEEILVEVFTRLRRDYPDLVLLLAPRHPERAAAIRATAARYGCDAMLRSEKAVPPDQDMPLLILDTIGELTDLYRHADLTFVGGSLVNEGGHNPLEPARYGKPVLFGPHMEDFAEIAADLLTAGGAAQCVDATGLFDRLAMLLADRPQMKVMGERGRDLVLQHRDVVCSHVRTIVKLLEAGKTG